MEIVFSRVACDDGGGYDGDGYDGGGGGNDVYGDVCGGNHPNEHHASVVENGGGGGSRIKNRQTASESNHSRDCNC